ncbi:hypothetical protein GCM10023347_19670 [Streptomyces chumphonensis]
MGRDDLAVRQQLAGVVEQQDAVAQEAPALFGVVGHRVGGLTVGGVGGRARWLVLTHGGGLSALSLRCDLRAAAAVRVHQAAPPWVLVVPSVVLRRPFRRDFPGAALTR